MRVYLAAVDSLGYLRHLEEHANFLHAVRRYHRLKHQWSLRSASLGLYVQSGDRTVGVA